MAPKKRDADGAAKAPSAFAHVFTGCRVQFTMLPPSILPHMGRMKARVAEFGGQVVEGPGAQPTHILCDRDMGHEELQKRMKDFQGPTEEGPYGLRLPAGAAFVTTDWVSRSMVQRAQQPADQFKPKFLKEAPPPPPQQPAAAAGGAGASGMQVEGAAPSAAAAADAQLPASQQQQQEQQQQQHAGLQEPADSVVTRPFDEREAQAAQEGVVEGAARAGGGGDVAAAAAAAAGAAAGEGGQGEPAIKPQFTGGATGIPWGSYGVWDEPYDVEAARNTVEKLKSFWYKKPQQSAGAQPDATQIPGKASGSVNQVCGHQCCALRPYCIIEKLEDFKRTVYTASRGQYEQFKVKAIDAAVLKLKAWHKPLDSDEDVEEVGLTKKAALKVKEIVSTGSSARVAFAEADERVQTINLFLQVWGVGPAFAAKWYSQGERTLDDLRRRQDLTEIQTVGLKYFDDLQERIPRAEVARAEALVREVCLRLVERHGATDSERTFCFATGSYRRGKADSSDVDFMIVLPDSLPHVDCADFLASLLTSLLQRGFLLDELHPTDPAAHRTDSACKASFMGLCRPAWAPCARRVDFKVYAAETRPFAVNYFTSGQNFNRALRLWANHAVPQLAQRYNPAAAGFKLSDKDLLPIRREHSHSSRGHRSKPYAGPGGAAEGGGGEQEEQHGGPSWAGPPPGREAVGSPSKPRMDGIVELGPAVPCADETDIFQALGLSFVPLPMRWFEDG